MKPTVLLLLLLGCIIQCNSTFTKVLVPHPGGIGGIFKGPNSETIVKGPDGSIITSGQEGGELRSNLGASVQTSTPAHLPVVKVSEGIVISKSKHDAIPHGISDVLLTKSSGIIPQVKTAVVSTLQPIHSTSADYNTTQISKVKPVVVPSVTTEPAQIQSSNSSSGIQTLLPATSHQPQVIINNQLHILSTLPPPLVRPTPESPQVLSTVVPLLKENVLLNLPVVYNKQGALPISTLPVKNNALKNNVPISTIPPSVSPSTIKIPNLALVVTKHLDLPKSSEAPISSHNDHFPPLVRIQHPSTSTSIKTIENQSSFQSIANAQFVQNPVPVLPNLNSWGYQQNTKFSSPVSHGNPELIQEQNQSPNNRQLLIDPSSIPIRNIVPPEIGTSHSTYSHSQAGQHQVRNNAGNTQDVKEEFHNHPIKPPRSPVFYTEVNPVNHPQPTFTNHY